MCEKAQQYISKNRLSNVISKIGEVHPEKDFGKLLGMFNKDILNDFLKEYDLNYLALENNENKSVNKFINKQAREMITVYLQKLNSKS